MSKIITHWTFAFVTVLVMLFVHYNNSSLVETARLKGFDFLQQQDTQVVSQDIGIVTIDEAALEKFGQWPWKRDILLIYFGNYAKQVQV